MMGSETMGYDMMGGWGGGLMMVLVLITVGLAIAALIKYLRS